MRLPTFLVLSLLMATPASAQVQLRFKFTPGEVLKQKMTQVMNSSTVLQGRDIKSAMKQSMHMEQAVDAEGNASVRQKITRLQMSMESPLGPGFQFNSEDENSAAKVPILGPILQQLAKTEFKARVAPTGQMTNIEVPASLLQAMKGIPGSPFGDGGPESIKQMIGQASTVFPEKSLSKGDSWTEDKSIKMPFGELQVHQTNTYEGANDEGLQVIDVSLEMELIPGENQQFAMTMKDSQAHGKMLFDGKQGQLVRSELTQTMTMQVTAAGQNFDQKIEQSVTVERDLGTQE